MTQTQSEEDRIPSMRREKTETEQMYFTPKLPNFSAFTLISACSLVEGRVKSCSSTREYNFKKEERIKTDGF